MPLTESFWIAFISVASGMVIKLTSMAYRSKCSECSCWGIKIIRKVELEIPEEPGSPAPK